MHKSVAFEWEKQSVLDTVSLQAMEGKKVFALFLLLSALVATAYTRSQAATNPKQPLSPEAVRDKPASLPPGVPEAVRDKPASLPPGVSEAVRDKPASLPPGVSEAVRDKPPSLPPGVPAYHVKSQGKVKEAEKQCEPGGC